jgi:hypothetical protein
MKQWDEIRGREFDWFAFDRDGHVAMLSTGGAGPIPESVIGAFAEHDAIADSLNAPNFGSPAVWSDYANLGLYVFDWDRQRRDYATMRAPSVAMEPSLRTRIENISRLPRYTGCFSSPEKLTNAASWSDG